MYWPVVIEWFASIWNPFGMLYIYKILNAFTDLGNSVTVQWCKQKEYLEAQGS